MKSSCVTGLYYIRCNIDYTFEQAVEIICCEESIGIESIALDNSLKIFAGISTADKSVAARYKATYQIVEQMSDNEGLVEIYFPSENLLQSGSLINSLFTTMMGDLFGIDVVQSIRLLDLRLDEKLAAQFPGPKYGIDGIQKFLGKSAPLVGVIAKPNLGMSPKELGKLVYDLCLQGADFIKDDELMMSPSSCSLTERTKYVCDMLEKANNKTGCRTLYAINISGDGSQTIDNGCTAVELGANCLMLNVFTTGFDILRQLASDKNLNVPIHTHRCMHDIFTKQYEFGVAPWVFAQLARLCGADFYHIGVFSNKNPQQIDDMCKVYNQLVKHNVNSLQKTMPVISRSSLLSIEKTHKFVPDLDVLFLICGSYYRSMHKDKIIGAMKDKLDFILKGFIVNEKYNECYDELKAMCQLSKEEEPFGNK